MRRLSILGGMAVALALALGGQAATPERAAACDHERCHPVVHHHCGHCHWVEGHYETRWQTVYGPHWETRQVFDGYRTETRRVPVTREVYEVSSDRYVQRVEYVTETVQVPCYRTEQVCVQGGHSVQVTVWVPGYWSCCHGCHHPYPMPMPPCRCEG